jgi:hypothetical protein
LLNTSPYSLGFTPYTGYFIFDEYWPSSYSLREVNEKISGHLYTSRCIHSFEEDSATLETTDSEPR